MTFKGRIVSVETNELSRSKLQRKDRAQLQIIATAMGAKPEAKARKADIVNMILDLAGIAEAGTTNANGALGPADTATDAATASVAVVDAEVADSSAQKNVQEVLTSPLASEQAMMSDAPVSRANGDTGEINRRTHRVDREGDRDRDHSASDRTDRDRDRTDRDRERSERDSQRTDRDRDGSRERSERNRQGRERNDRGRQEELPEMGNRRRRRGRGRDRDRPEEQWEGTPIPIAGHLDLRDDGYGFLRTKGFQPSKDDAYVSVKQVRQFGLRKGDQLAGSCRPATRNEKNAALLQIDSVNEQPPEAVKQRPNFEDLTPLFPDQKLRLERNDDPANMTCRIIDLLSPIGKGQRGLIVSPPKAGKTTIMKEIVRSIELNNPEVHLLVLLVDERPEEVTDMRRWLLRGEVAASTFDRPADEHTHVAEMTIERAKRMVERGEDVVIMLDGITRLSRAYNLAAPATGRIMSGGIDTGALYPPKKFFGAARNVEEGGSLTILATALVETGSRMDEVIFEEFKGTGNMELRLDRHIAERRIYPAINVDASSTRHEELLFERKQLQQVWKLRRVLNGLSSDGDGGGAAGLELLMDRLRTFPNNAAFLEEVAKGPAGV